MRLKVASAIIVVLLLTSVAPLSMGKQNGKFSSGGGCSCHYGGSATVSMSGLPASYTAGQSYTLSISVSGGVSGSNGGFSLDVDKGTLSTGGIGIMAVKVDTAGKSATHTTSSYRSWSVDWTAPSTGSGITSFDLSALTASGDGTYNGDAWGSTSSQIAEGGGATPNSPPSATNLQLSPTNPVTTDTLTLAYSYQDSDGDAESGTEIRWYKDDVLENSRNDQLTVPPSLTSKGESWYATVTPSDGDDAGTMETSSNLNVVNSIPAIQTASITPSSPNENDDLTVDWTSIDADGDVRTVSGIEWYVDGSKVSAFDNDVTIPSVAIRDGDVWHSKVKVNDGEIDSAWFTSQNVTIGSDNTAPVMSSVTLNGPYTTVDDLVASALGNDIDGDTLTYEWEWLGTSITSSTLPSSQTSKGESWKVSCRVTDGTVFSEWMESSSVIIQNTAPVLSSVTIDQDSVFFESEATYSFEATDVDGDVLSPNEVWSLEGDILTLQLYVNDNDFSNSETLSDTVLIANSPPIVTYNGGLSFDALQDIEPSADLITDDANGDDVTLSWAWSRNGFSTNYNQGTISASSLGAGDSWMALITPNDGIEDGQTLVLEFTITNTAPTAVISGPESLIQGATATFSASNSTDIDGAVVNAIWSIDGAVVHNGMTLNTLMVDELNLQVKVVDDMGATATSSMTYTGVLPPYATNTEAKSDGSEVVLTWEGNAEEWAIVHNGEFIDTTKSTKYRHAPTMAGEHTYNILPIVDGQQIQWNGATSTDDVELSSTSVPETPGPSETFGMIFSIVMLLAGITGVALSFIPRRD
jgi:hypothetical protein